MKIEIWSDVVCPFCYIGKRKFESALAQFENKNKVEVTWKSFQLDPNTKFKEGSTIYQNLAESKGWSEEQSKNITQQVVDMGKQEGLEFNFEKAIPANTFNAHRLIHFAASHKLQEQAQEALLKAYFIEGKNVEDTQTLISIGLSIGLSQDDLRKLFAGEAYTNDVENDIYEARQVGVKGVPFFVIDRKYAISGAQPVDVFLKTLERAWAETPTEQSVDGGNNCSVDGKC